MHKRIFKFDKKQGRTVEVTPEGEKKICNALSRDIEPIRRQIRKTGYSVRAAKWPYASDQIAFDDEAITIAREKLTREGVHCDFDSEGRAILESSSHRKRVAEVLGFYDRNAGYGDPLPKHYDHTQHSRSAIRQRREQIGKQIQEIERSLSRT